MELRIISPSQDGFIKAIEWNNEEIKAEMAAKVADYKNMVYGDNQIKEAKKDRAELNKMVTALEDKRKEIKALCLQPYERFETQMKELVAIVKEPIGIIDSQVKAYEEQQKAKKIEEIKAYYAEKGCEIPVEQIWDKKWENATTSLKSVKDAIDSKVEEINTDLELLSKEAVYSYEAIEYYKRTLDIRGAMNEVKRLEEQAKAKAEYEAQKAAEKTIETAEVEKPTEEGKEEIGTGTTEPQTEDNFIPDFGEIGDNRHWLIIKAHVDLADHAELLAFLDEKKIEYTIV